MSLRKRRLKQLGVNLNKYSPSAIPAKLPSNRLPAFSVTVIVAFQSTVRIVHFDLRRVEEKVCAAKARAGALAILAVGC